MKDYDLSVGDVSVLDGDVKMIDGDNATRQRIEQKFNLWQGEWFLNVSAGFPWMQNVMGQRPRPEVLHSLVHDLVSSDPGVKAVSRIDLRFDGEPRRLHIVFSAALNSGGEINDMEIAL